MRHDTRHTTLMAGRGTAHSLRRALGTGALAFALCATLAACSSGGAKGDLVSALPAAINAVTSGQDNRSDYFQSINDGTSDTTVCFVTQHGGGNASLTMDFDASITATGKTCSGTTPAAGIFLVGTSVYAMDAASANRAYNQASTTPELAASLAKDLAAQQIDPSPLKAIVEASDEVTATTKDGITTYSLKASYSDVTAMLGASDSGTSSEATEPTPSTSGGAVAKVTGDLTIAIDGSGRLSSFSYTAAQSATELGGAPGQSWQLNVWYDYDAAPITAPANAVPTVPPTTITSRDDLEAFAGI